ncbi:MAG: hypothetical protein AB1424_01875 [Thermodesulfobacteriota bacterium]
MEVIDGGFKKGSWLHDRGAYSDDEIAEMNERFRKLINRHPECRSFLEFFIWDIQQKTEPQIVK